MRSCLLLLPRIFSPTCLLRVRRLVSSDISVGQDDTRVARVLVRGGRCGRIANLGVALSRLQPIFRLSRAQEAYTCSNSWERTLHEARFQSVEMPLLSRRVSVERENRQRHRERVQPRRLRQRLRLVQENACARLSTQVRNVLRNHDNIWRLNDVYVLRNTVFSVGTILNEY